MIFLRSPKTIILSFSLALVVFALHGTMVLGQETDIAERCKLENIETACSEVERTECRKLLEQCEAYYQEESARIGKDLTKTEQEKRTLNNTIYSLNQKIRSLSYQISQSNLVIKDIGLQVEDTELSIGKTEGKIGESKEKLAVILQEIYQEDLRGTVEIVFSGDSLSDFFDNVIALEILNEKNKDLLQNIRILKTNLENQKVSLDDEKDDLERVVKLRTLQKSENTRTKRDQEYYLQLTEREYQEQLQEKKEIQQKAAEIQTRIFELIGVPDAPTFGQAYEIAKRVERITGVRPALLLAVLTQESNIGKNVGQCYLKNSKTGAGIVIVNGKTLSRVMKPSRDVQPFLTITKELGKDPYSTPVSCPMSFGYGGAMGPAQFIPSTWMIYRDRLKDLTGRPADPWNINDAFLASALYLGDFGAKKQTYNGEWRAAMIYFSGSTNLRYRFYGDSVMKITAQYAKDIAQLEQAR